MIEPLHLWPAIGMAETEAAAIQNLSANLHGIPWNVEACRAALELYKFAKDQQRSRQVRAFSVATDCALCPRATP